MSNQPTDLDVSVHVLALNRNDLAYQMAERERLLVELQRTEIGHQLLLLDEEIKRTKETITQHEQRVAFDAMQAYDGEDKNVHPAVKIKTFTKVDYDPALMLEYAIEHDMPALIQLNKRNANSFAKGVAAPEFVETYTEDKATIAKDLSDYV